MTATRIPSQTSSQARPSAAPRQTTLFYLAGPASGCAVNLSGLILARCDTDGGQESVMHKSTRQMLQAMGREVVTVTFYLAGYAQTPTEEIIERALHLDPGMRLSQDECAQLLRLARTCLPGVPCETGELHLIREHWPAWRH